MNELAPLIIGCTFLIIADGRARDEDVLAFLMLGFAVINFSIWVWAAA
jgi:hypothetical protein